MSEELNIRVSGNENRIGKLRCVGTKMIYDTPYEIYLVLTDDAKDLKNLSSELKTKNKKVVLHFALPQQDGKSFISIHRLFDDINESFSEKLLDAYITGNHSGIYQYKGIILNTSAQTIQYLKNAPVEIKSNNQEIRLFMLFMENKGNVIEYVRIGKYLAFAKNIHQTYVDAPKFLKKHYLRFFFEKIVVKDKKIHKVVPTPVFKILRNRHEIIIRQLLLSGLDDVRTYLKT